MTGSEFKFLRRVRIHDGECGAVARALHHAAQKVALVRNEQSLISDECIPLRQAGSEKASDSTFNERKQMSTKTSIKRIALVAVSALGFGLLSVVPSNAALLTATAATQFGNPVAGTGSAFMTATIASYAGATDTLEMRVTAGPVGGTLTVSRINSDTAFTFTGADAILAVADTAETTFESVDATANGSQIIYGTFNLPGTYTVILGDVSGSLGTAYASATISVSNPATSVPVASTDLVAPVPATSAGSGTEPTISVYRPSGVSGDLYYTVTASPDSDLVVGTSAKSSTTGAGSDKVITVAQVGTGGTTNALLTTFILEGATDGDDLIKTPGAYKFLFWIDANGNGIRDAGEPTSAEFTQNLVGAAAAISASVDKSLLAHNVAGYNTFVLTVSATDIRGASLRTVPTIVEKTGTDVLSLDTSTSMTHMGGGVYQYTGTTKAAPATGDFADTVITVTVGAETEDVDLRVVTVGTLSTLTSIQAEDKVGVGLVTAGVKTQSLRGTGTDASGDLSFTVDRAVTSVGYTFYAAAGEEGEYLLVDVAPSAGTGTDKLAPAKAIVRIGENLEAKYTVTVTSPVAASATAGTSATAYVLTASGAGANVTATATYATATPSWSTSPAGAIKAKNGDTISITGSLGDQFGRVLDAKAVTASVTGRNPATFNALTTNAAGQVTVTYTDASTSTTALKDTITFTYTYFPTATSTASTTASSTAVTATFSATGIAVGSVTIAAPSNQTDRPIDQAQTGATPNSFSIVSYTATVRDAAGDPVGAGAIVTFAGGADDIFTEGRTKVTNEFGQASIGVYRQKAGSPSITATSGGVTSVAAAAVNWRVLVRDTDAHVAANTGRAVTGTADYHARYVTLTSDQAKVASEGVLRFTAKVTDRFGNPVSGVEITFSENGAGRFMSNQTNPASTNSLGEVSIDLNSSAGETGTASVTALISDVNSVQKDDIAGIMSFVTVDTDTDNNISAAEVSTYTTTTTAITGLTAAVKSATATATIEKSTAVSTADALLELAKAIGTGNSANAAADAALEAIDAANAATDAANLAAEAADAATVAAEEARDAADAATAAVEALASEVATLVAALKAQITTLANTVAKIAKRVKA